MLNPCLSSSSARGLNSQNPPYSHHFQALFSHSSLSAPFKSNLKPYLLSTRKPLQKRKLSLESRHSDYIEPHQQQQQWASSNNSSFSPQPGTLPPKVYIGYSIYKGKAALTVVPRAPEFTPLQSGAFKLSKEGYVFLQFAPAAGVRQYDWSRKQVFTLSVTEMGSLINLGKKDSCEFFHDPNKGKSDEGKVRKVLKIEPMPDESGHFFNLSVQNKLMNVDENIYMPVTKAEFAVLVSAFNFVLPYLLGWHTFVNSFSPEDYNANPRLGADFEWGR